MCLVVKSSQALTSDCTPFSWPGLNEEIDKDYAVSILLSSASQLLSSLLKTYFHDTKRTENLRDHPES